MKAQQEAMVSAATIILAGRIASPGNVPQSATVASLKMFPLPHAAPPSFTRIAHSFGSTRAPSILSFSNRHHERTLVACSGSFFCSTAPQAFFCPDRGFPTPTRAAAVKDGPSSGHRFSGAQRP
jgi:hypothetical protein